MTHRRRLPDTVLAVSTLLLPLAVAALLPVPGGAAAQTLAERTNRGLVELVTGSADGSSARIGEDLADLLDDGATRRILPVIGKGSQQNLVDLRALRGIDLAIVQADVLDRARRPSGTGAGATGGADTGMTYVAKLNNEELHLLAGPAIKSIADLAGKKVNIGVPGGGTAVTAPAVFELLKVKVETTSYEQPLALAKLRAGEIAAVAYVTGKPAPLFTALRSSDGLHFVAVPLEPQLLASYVPTRLSSEDYPDLVPAGQSVDAIAVGTVLMAANLTPDSERYRNLVQFVDAFFTQFPKLLEAPRHPKWQEVNLAADLPGWRRFPAADAWLKRNAAAPVAAPSDQQLRDIFTRFLDERSKAATGRTLSPEDKEQLFDQFRQWQTSQTR